MYIFVTCPFIYMKGLGSEIEGEPKLPENQGEKQKIGEQMLSKPTERKITFNMFEASFSPH